MQHAPMMTRRGKPGSPISHRCEKYVNSRRLSSTKTKIVVKAASFIKGYSLIQELEPYVRQRWPHAIISWSRLLAGRLRDAKVGGDILVGIASGCAMALLFQLYQALI